MLDLGAGTGRLTAELASAARHVVAVELDARMAGRLSGRWPNVEVVEGDAAAVGFHVSRFVSWRTSRSTGRRRS